MVGLCERYTFLKKPNKKRAKSPDFMRFSGESISSHIRSYAKGIAGVYSSGNEAGNVVENIFDGEIGTKWAHDANPSVVWFKLDPTVTFDHINIALTNGHLRHYNMEVAVYHDGAWDVVWDKEKKSSGTTDQLETFKFSHPVAGEWLRFYGQGSDVNAWNNLSEITGIPLQAGPKGVVVINNEMQMDLVPVEANGETYLPFLAVAEKVNYKTSWNQATGVVTAVDEESGWNFSGKVGALEYTTHEGTFPIEKPLTVIDGTLMVPLDSMDEFISYNAGLNETSHVYSINYQRATKEILAALDELGSMVNVDGQMKLYASLTDPETGAMYFGQGAVNRKGFGVFIEGTAQAGSAAVWQKYDPVMLEKLGKWVQGLQDPATGWFTEPEFTIEGSSDGKKQRSLSMGLSILTACGMEPLYLTPTQRVQQNQAAEAAGEKAEDTSGGNDVVAEQDAKYQSLDAYMEFVKTTYDWDHTGIGKSTWAAGNEIGDIAGTLKELGYLDAVSEFIRSKQNPENGLFSKEIDINGISAVTKLSGMFTLTGTPMPYMDKIIESAAWLAENWEFGGISEPYNISLSMRYMVASAGSAGLDAETQKQLNEAAPRFVRGLTAGMRKFLKEDGGFGYSPGGPCTHSQGAQALPAGLDCADINGNQLGLGVISDCFWMMGMTAPVYRDIDLWWKYYNEMEPLNGKPLVPMPGTDGYDFEGVLPGERVKGIGKASTVIEDPVNWNNQCLEVSVLKGMSIAGSDNIGEEVTAFNFSIMLGDIRRHGSGFFYCTLGNAVQLVGAAGNGKLSLYLRRHGSEGYTDVLCSGLNPWEWYDIRLEYYNDGKNGDAGDGNTITKCYVNGKYTGSSKKFLNSQIPSSLPGNDVSGMSLTAFMNTDGEFYLDNISWEAIK